MAITNPFTEKTLVSQTVTAVDTDGSGDVDGYDYEGDSLSQEIVVEELRHIESPADVSVQASGGYVANCIGVSGNTITVRLFESAGSNASMSAVASGTDVTDLHIQAKGN